jgi:hypothetical protein
VKSAAGGREPWEHGHKTTTGALRGGATGPDNFTQELKGTGFTGCGKTPLRANFKGFVTGHDFSHADKANQINIGI